MKKQLRVLATLLLSAVWSFGQVSTATLQGAVKDQTGALIPGVSVRARNTETGAERTVVTNESGAYRIPQLAVGTYEIRAELQGFQTAIRSGITLTVGMQAVVDLQLTVGEIREVVEVTGEAPQVQTAASDVSELVDAKTIRELPLNGRNFVQLATLQVGVAFSDRVRGGNPTIAGTGMRFNVNGTRYNNNSFLLDGQDIQDTFNATPASGGGETLGVDTLQEFQVKTANYSAEYSKSAGAVINAVTKSGTNQIRGSAFMFHRNDNLDARNFFDQTKPEFRRHQFGATVGGPIVQNKTFYFAGYEAIREGQGFTRRFIVPTDDARGGRLRTPAGQIEQVSIAPQVRPYLDALFPLRPNGADLGGGRAEHFAVRTDVKNDDFFVVKIDHRLGNSDSISARYSFDDGRFLRATGTIFAPSLPSRNQFVNLQEQKIFSPNVVNTLRGGYNRSRLASTDVPLITIPQNLIFAGKGLGTLTITGFSDLGNSILSPRDFVLNVFDVSDTLAITRGSHLIKLGGNLQRFQANLFTALWPYGSYSFTTWRDFLLGNARQFTSLAPDGDPVRGFRQTLVGLFLQDDMKVRQRLTLNLGLRYEFVTVPTEVYNRIANVRGPYAPEITLGNPLYENPSLLGFAPRVGLAWDMTGDGKSSLRSGFGIFHSQILPNMYRTALTGNEPFARNLVMFSPPFPNALSVARASPARNVFSFPFDPAHAATYQWNLTLQRELFSEIVASVGYVGTRGVHLPRNLGGQEANVPIPTIVEGRTFFPAGARRRNPNFQQIRVTSFDGNSFYHGFQVSVRRRVTQGLQFQTSYTFSHSIDEASGLWTASADFAGSPGPQDMTNARSERASSAFDQRHNFSANFTYDLPSPRTNQALGKLIGGWQLSGILSLSTGFPFTVLVSGAPDRDRDLSTADTRPDLVPGRSNNPVVGNPRRWFDPTAFRLPDPGFYGNLGRNTVRGDGFANLDFALLKNTTVGENLSVQFRAEIFNILNHPNFQIPAVRTIFVGNSPTPLADSGLVDATANSSRQIQFGLKFLW